jgi:hypothetical protein
MAVRRRRGSTAALALTAALSVGSALLLTACGPDETASPGAAKSAAPTLTASAPTGTPSPAGKGPAPSPVAAHSGTPAPGGSATPGSATPGGTTAPGGPAVPTRGTGSPHLTISNGTDLVQMTDSVVDFHTQVRDLAWAPDGTRAVFINGNGDLVTALPDGTGQILIATNPGGQTWSHPTWVMAMPNAQTGSPHQNNIIFTADQGGTTRLMQVRGDAGNATPTALPLPHGLGDPALPQTGNTWANAGGNIGSIVYENTADGSVYIHDDYTRSQGYKLTEGSEPALSPDGHEVVFVRSVGGHDHLFEMQLDQPQMTANLITPMNDSTDYTEPAWSPDGTEITVRTPHGTATLPADGSLTPHQSLYDVPGLPAYLP